MLLLHCNEIRTTNVLAQKASKKLSKYKYIFRVPQSTYSQASFSALKHISKIYTVQKHFCNNDALIDEPNITSLFIIKLSLH